MHLTDARHHAANRLGLPTNAMCCVMVPAWGAWGGWPTANWADAYQRAVADAAVQLATEDRLRRFRALVQPSLN